MGKTKYHFGGYATRNDILCTDGRMIKQNAFKHQDGLKVPIVWQHDHDNPENTIGHGYLENRDDGVYIRGIFNNTKRGRHAKSLVEHGDVHRLSIFAKIFKEFNGQVVHGDIKEVSLVFSGANEGAYIDAIGIEHSEDGSYEGVIYGWAGDIIEHSEDFEDSEDEEDYDDLDEDEDEDEELEHADDAKKGKTVGEIMDTMTEEQKNLLTFLIASLMTEEAAKHSDEDGDEIKHSDYESEDNNVKRNIFENGKDSNYIQHGEKLMAARDTILHSAIDNGVKSLKDTFMKHAEEYGITNIDFLFPEYQNLNESPDFIKRDTGWVSVFLDKAKKTPFAKVKAVHAKITEEQARAKGYFKKGTKKMDEVIALLKREISPTTIYKKQKLDRDDIIDMNFNVISWLKAEMDIMMKEEMARAMLVGDGRTAAADDKINPLNIIPIYTDDELYSVKVPVAIATGDNKAEKFIDAVIRNRKKYKGTGNPTLFATEDIVAECLLLKDNTGHYIYKSVTELATTLRVSSIETVEVMDGLTRDGKELGAIMVNPIDYNIGTNAGGKMAFFHDFDLNLNQELYLKETRLSGGLVKPYSALVFEFEGGGAEG